ncbi:MAG: C1 family peptidase, partial [Bdellovibrionota bacterium]
MQSMDVLKATSPTYKVDLSAIPFFSRFQIRRMGLVPEGVWSPTRDFEKPPYSGRLQTYVQNVIDRAKFEVNSTSDSAKQAKIVERAQADIIAIFNDLAGSGPNEFMYEGKSYTPHTFAREFFAEELTLPIVNMVVSEHRSGGDIHEKVNDGFLVVGTNIDRVTETVKALLDMGLPVYLGYEHEATYVDNATGIMSTQAFHHPTNARPLSRRQRVWSERHAGGHAVQIVGYDLDPATGKIVKFKIKNSWGRKGRSRGYYHMYIDYFRAYAQGITFYQSAGVKLPTPTHQFPVQQELGF